MEKVNKIAIKIVKYDGEKWLEKCIGPLYGYDNIKIVVVDNASSDNTVELIKKKYENVELIESKINLGFGQANNKGFDYAIANNYDFVFLLNQDASIDIKNLNQLIGKVINDPAIGIISPVHYKNEEEIENLFKYYIKENKLEDFVGSNKIHSVDFVNAALWLIPINVLKKIGGFNPLFFHYGEDVDYVNRIKYNNFQVIIDFNSKAYHYREYSKEVFQSKFKRKAYFGPWPVKYFTILSNVNYSFFNVFFQSFYLFGASFYRYLKKLDFQLCITCIKVYFRVLLKLNYIKKNRKIIIKNSSPFL